MYLMSNVIIGKSLLESLNMIYRFGKGDCSAIQMAYKKLLVLKNEHNFLDIIFLLRDLIKKSANQNTLLTKYQN